MARHSRGSSAALGTGRVSSRPLARKVSDRPSDASRPVQSSQSGNARRRSSSNRRGDTSTDTVITSLLRTIPRGMTVKRICWLAIVETPSGERRRVLVPDRRRLEHVEKPRVTAAAAELLLDGDVDRRAEERHLDLDRQGGPAGGLAVLVAEAEHELERDRDEAEHRQLAAQAQVAAEDGQV